jgi:hypothetical protein
VAGFYRVPLLCSTNFESLLINCWRLNSSLRNHFERLYFRRQEPSQRKHAPLFATSSPARIQAIGFQGQWAATSWVEMCPQQLGKFLELVDSRGNFRTRREVFPFGFLVHFAPDFKP